MLALRRLQSNQYFLGYSPPRYDNNNVTENVISGKAIGESSVVKSSQVKFIAYTLAAKS